MHATKCNFVSQKESYDTFSYTALASSLLITYLSVYSSRPFVFHNNHWFFINLFFKFSYSFRYFKGRLNLWSLTLSVESSLLASFVINATGIWNCKCSPCLNIYLTYTIIQRAHILYFHYMFSAQTAKRNKDSMSVHLFTCMFIWSMVLGVCLEVIMKI